MRIKSKPQDFRVYELLKDGYVGGKGKFRVYRVTKTKLTSLEAASELALATGVRTSEIGMAGMKDRQGVTTQFMSVRGGKPVRFQTPSIKVETAGFALHPLSSRDSIGNGFEIALRGVEREEAQEIDREARAVREHGVPNYFGEQRFGNLRHGQGWVAKELALGRAETALKNLLASPSENDNPHMRSFKRGLDSAWGDWKRCRDVAGAYGAHHSIFEHLADEPDDFAGAFRYVKTEVRLIHLYAFQSHLWNRAVARFIGETARGQDRLMVPSLEGPLAFSRSPLPIPDAWNGTFRMPGEGLEDVEDADQRRWLTAALAAEGLRPEDFRIHGVDGFGIKGEDRQLVVRPRALEIFPDRRSDGVLHVSFDLPRGSYATLVLARLAPTRAAETPDDAARRMRREEEAQRLSDERRNAPRRSEDSHAERGYRERRYGERDERPRDEGQRFEPRGHEPRRDDRDRDGPQRPWIPRDEPRRDFQPRNEPRREWPARDEPRRELPSRDEARRDFPSRDEPRRDAPRPFEPRREERPRFDRPRTEPDRFPPQRRRQRPMNPRLAERRFDGPPVEYKPPTEERYDHSNPDGRRRARPYRPDPARRDDRERPAPNDRTTNEHSDRRPSAEGERGARGPEPRDDDRRNDT